MKERLRNDQKHCLAYCKAIVSKLNVRFKPSLNDTPEAAAAKEVSHLEACFENFRC